MTPDSLVICQQLLTPAAAPPRTYQPAVVPPWMVARHTRRLLLQHIVHPVTEHGVNFQVATHIRIDDRQLVAHVVTKNQGAADFHPTLDRRTEGRAAGIEGQK